MAVDPLIKKIKIEGHRHTRTLTCPYCRKVINVSLVPHMRKAHPKEWAKWSDEMIELYNQTNDLKRVMRAFANSDGQMLFTWGVVDYEVKRRLEDGSSSITFQEKPVVKRWEPSNDEYQRFTTTVWDVPRRGTWGVHQSTYRGNWAPQIPRAIIELYSKPGDLVIDPFVGGGTTLLEAWALGRNAIGFDVSDFPLQMTRSRLREFDRKANRESLFGLPAVDIKVKRGDARTMPGISPKSVDLICTHPPYGDALTYSHDVTEDLSQISDPMQFMEQIATFGTKCFEVLKPGGICAVLIGDLRRDGKLNTFGLQTVQRFTSIGFELEDLIIKTQNQDRSTEFFYKSDSIRMRLRHEYLLVFSKAERLPKPRKARREK